MVVKQIASTTSDELFAVMADGTLWRYGYPTPATEYVDGIVIAYPRTWTRIWLP